MKNKTNRKGSGAAKVVAIGAGIAGVAATAYFFLGPDGKKHQKDAKAWTVKMKGDVLKKLKAVRTMSEPAYRDMIDAVATKYEKKMKADHKEIWALAQDLKKHWKAISNGAPAAKRRVVKKAKKVVRKAGSVPHVASR